MPEVVELGHPIKLGSMRKVGSKQIVDAFLSQPEPEWEVNFEETKRDAQNVYTSLLMYIDRHPELGIEVFMHERKICIRRIDNVKPT